MIFTAYPFDVFYNSLEFLFFLWYSYINEKFFSQKVQLLLDIYTCFCINNLIYQDLNDKLKKQLLLLKNTANEKDQQIRHLETFKEQLEEQFLQVTFKTSLKTCILQ